MKKVGIEIFDGPEWAHMTVESKKRAIRLAYKEIKDSKSPHKETNKEKKKKIEKAKIIKETALTSKEIEDLTKKQYPRANDKELNELEKNNLIFKMLTSSLYSNVEGKEAFVFNYLKTYFYPNATSIVEIINKVKEQKTDLQVFKDYFDCDHADCSDQMDRLDEKIEPYIEKIVEATNNQEVPLEKENEILTNLLSEISLDIKDIEDMPKILLLSRIEKAEKAYYAIFNKNRKLCQENYLDLLSPYLKQETIDCLERSVYSILGINDGKMTFIIRFFGLRYNKITDNLENVLKAMADKIEMVKNRYGIMGTLGYPCMKLDLGTDGIYACLSCFAAIPFEFEKETDPKTNPLFVYEGAMYEDYKENKGENK